MVSTALTPLLNQHITLSQKDSVILMVRWRRAQASGIDAMVQLAISEGELAPDQLENLSLLTSGLVESIEELAAFLDDLNIAGSQQGGHDE